MVVDIDSDEEYGREEEGEEGEKHEVYAKDDQDMEVFVQDVRPEEQLLLAASGVHTDTGVEYVSEWCILTTSVIVAASLNQHFHPFPSPT